MTDMMMQNATDGFAAIDAIGAAGWSKGELVVMHASTRNPIAKSFAAGINPPQVIPNKRRTRKLRSRERYFEFDEG